MLWAEVPLSNKQKPRVRPDRLHTGPLPIGVAQRSTNR